MHMKAYPLLPNTNLMQLRTGMLESVNGMRSFLLLYTEIERKYFAPSCVTEHFIQPGSNYNHVCGNNYIGTDSNIVPVSKIAHKSSTK